MRRNLGFGGGFGYFERVDHCADFRFQVHVLSFRIFQFFAVRSDREDFNGDPAGFVEFCGCGERFVGFRLKKFVPVSVFGEAVAEFESRRRLAVLEQFRGESDCFALFVDGVRFVGCDAERIIFDFRFFFFNRLFFLSGERKSRSAEHQSREHGRTDHGMSHLNCLIINCWFI